MTINFQSFSVTVLVLWPSIKDKLLQNIQCENLIQDPQDFIHFVLSGTPCKT